ncbi:MAG: PH domain-containing protein [Nocardioides sp.]
MWRPIGPRIVAIVVGLCLLVVCTATWWTIGAENRAEFSFFQKSTLVALGLGIFGCLWALGRSKVEAYADRLVIINGFRRRELAWAQVISVNLPAGAPWVTLDLSDGDVVSAMGIQGSDGRSSVDAVRTLRALVQENS